MNRVQSILFLLTFSIASIAGPACPANGHVSGTEAAEGLAGIISKIGGAIDPSGLALEICTIYYHSVIMPDSIGAFEKGVMLKLGLDEKDPNIKKIIGDFLNEKHDQLICGEEAINRLRENEPLLKRSIGRGEFKLLYQLLDFEDEYRYDLNHFEVVDGKKETILDYIEKILNDPEILSNYDSDKMKLLRNDLIEYEAKRGTEL
jgi:hypothetical protein